LRYENISPGKEHISLWSKVRETGVLQSKTLSRTIPTCREKKSKSQKAKVKRQKSKRQKAATWQALNPLPWLLPWAFLWKKESLCENAYGFVLLSNLIPQAGLPRGDKRQGSAI